MRLLCLCWLWFFQVLMTANAEMISVPLQKADWFSPGSQTQCLLQQKIPLHGKIGFKQRAGEALHFIYQPGVDEGLIKKASFYLDTAPWRSDYIDRENFQVFYSPDENEFYVGRKGADAALNALLKGQSAVFQFDSGAGISTVLALPVGIDSKITTFSQCRQQLLPFNKEQLQGVVYFKPGGTQLEPEDVKRLKKISRLLKTLKAVSVVISSETSFAGKSDKRWFTRRAELVKQQLLKMGAPANRILIRFRPLQAGKNHLILSLFGPDSLRLYHYRKGSTRLSSRQQQRLAKLAQYIEQYFKKGRIIIASHTDAKGRRATNLKVSQRRGEAVKQFLVKQGVPESRIQVKAYGESRPIKSNRFPPGRAMNRRVEISLRP